MTIVREEWIQKLKEAVVICDGKDYSKLEKLLTEADKALKYELTDDGKPFILAGALLADKSTGCAKPLLHFAIEKRDQRLVELLIRKGADVYSRDYDGNNAVMCAVLNACPVALIDYLIEGAEPKDQQVLLKSLVNETHLLKAKNTKGQTAQQIAVAQFKKYNDASDLDKKNYLLAAKRDRYKSIQVCLDKHFTSENEAKMKTPSVVSPRFGGMR